MIYLLTERERLDEENRLTQQNQCKAQNLGGTEVEARPQVDQIEIETI